MNISEWAKQEIDIAIKRERGNDESDEWDYGVACYESAYKAFKSLIVEDGHSGMSISITKSILNRLIDGKPLTPIEDIPGIWDISFVNEKEGYTSYQCNRCSSLFKDEYTDGHIVYSSVRDVVCVDNSKQTYYMGFIADLYYKLHPITMPYYPLEKPVKLICDDFLYDKKNGAFDHQAFLKIINPDGSVEDVNRFFMFEDGERKEISEKEYYEHREKRVK